LPGAPAYNPASKERRMDHLYTPWRMAYIRGDKADDSGCVFCAAQSHSDDDALIVARGHYHFAILNRYPYNNGHLMIVPYAHIGSQEALDSAALLELMQMTNQALAALRAVYRPAAFNLGANIGQAAGAGIAEHFHYHIVPRWPGDANFMTVTADTRVIPDTLEHTYQEVKSAWAHPWA
jgi:ATP adenylyltransferase